MPTQTLIEHPVLWFTYLTLKAGGTQHFPKTLRLGIWGVPKNYPTIIRFRNISEDDLIAFIGPGKGFPGRSNLLDWKIPTFRGYFENVKIFRVTEGYYYDETKIWTPIGKKWKNERWPHRFKFDPKPLVDLHKILINKLNESSIKNLHSVVYANLVRGKSSTLSDILLHSSSHGMV